MARTLADDGLTARPPQLGHAQRSFAPAGHETPLRTDVWGGSEQGLAPSSGARSADGSEGLDAPAPHLPVRPDLALPDLALPDLALPDLAPARPE